MAGLNPFHRAERTTFLTPARRIEAVHALAAQADGTDSAEQQEIVQQLAQQLMTEPDPLVREAVLKACGKFASPLATQSLVAGMNDQDPHVRLACCKQLAYRSDETVAKELARVARGDESFDVRIAAAEALGNCEARSATEGLLVALEDPNPAMQVVGVEAMKKRTGNDHGGNVAAYVAEARGETAPESPSQENRETAVAQRRDWFPFF